MARRRAEKPKDHRVMVRLDDELHNWLKAEAERRDMDVGPFLRLLIEEEKRRGEESDG